MKAHNMSADSVLPFPDVIEIRPGEIWQQKNGVYMFCICLLAGESCAVCHIDIA